MAYSQFSLDLEKVIISAVLNYTDVYPEISNFITSNDFSKVNSVIFEVIKNIIENKGTPSPVLIAEKIKALSLNLPGIEVLDYLDALKRLDVKRSEVISIAKELKKFTLVRNIVERADKLKKEVTEGGDKDIGEIVERVDHAFGDSLITLGDSNTKVQNVYEMLPDFIEELGNEPDKPNGYVMPYKTWDAQFGLLKPCSVSVNAARQGSGKSTFLMDCADKIVTQTNKNQDIKVLYLDTEMTCGDYMVRLAAARSGAPHWLIDSRQWRKDSVWCPKIRGKLQEIKNGPKNVFFEQVGSTSINDTCSLIKRWYFNTVGRGNKCLIVYDYIKVLIADRSRNLAEYAAALDKVQYLKDVADFINAPLLSAIQLNRYGVVTNKAGESPDDSENAISISDRIGWIVSFMGILRRHTPEEYAEAQCTHRLVKLKGRTQGREGMGHMEFIKIVEGSKVRFVPNHLLFNIDNFNVEDKGDYRELIKRVGKSQLDVSNKQEVKEDIAF